MSYLKLEKLCFEVTNWLVGAGGDTSIGKRRVIKSSSIDPYLPIARHNPKVTGTTIRLFHSENHNYLLITNWGTSVSKDFRYDFDLF